MHRKVKLMAIILNLQLMGDDALIRRFNALPEKMQGKVFRPAVRVATKLVMQDAKKNAPKRTGALRRGLFIKPFKRKRRGGNIGLMILTPTRDKLNIKSDAKWYYPSLAELGHKKRKSGGRVEGRPFLRNAIKNNRAAALDTLRREMRTRIGALQWPSR
jgi:HK97 gp10 family phage protein